MVFSSAAFLFRFLPAVLAVYFLVPRRAVTVRNAVLLAASLVFYFLGEGLGVFIMIASIAVNYTAALPLAALKKRGRAGAARAVFILGLCCGLGLLVYYKYAGFIAGEVSALTGAGWTVPNIVMPIGISFFTFQGTSYLIDVYRGTCPASKNPLDVATYVTLFPQLVAGPIVRYTDVAEDLHRPRGSLEGAANGAARFAVGLAKKMLIANPLSEAATAIFAENGHSTPALAWLGALTFALQIYFDFSGYSDMACGVGTMLGFCFPENFNYPYVADSVTDFWRRWHMTLSGWFRDYVYVPLGGNRRGVPRQILNLLIVWGLTGLWHGASWNFVVWGLYFAILLIAEKFIFARLLARIPGPVRRLITLLFVLFGWVIFNAETLPGALEYLGAMFAPNGRAAGNGALYYLLEYKLELALGILLSTPILRAALRRIRSAAARAAVKYTGAAALLALSFMRVVGSSFNPFIYFRF